MKEKKSAFFLVALSFKFTAANSSREVRPEKKVFFGFGGFLTFFLWFLGFGFGETGRSDHRVQERVEVICGRSGGLRHVGLGGLGEEARPGAARVVGVALVRVARLEVDPVGLGRQSDLAEPDQIIGARAHAAHRALGRGRERGQRCSKRHRRSGIGSRRLLCRTARLHRGALCSVLLRGETGPRVLALLLGLVGRRRHRGLAVRDHRAGCRDRGGLRGGLALTGLCPALAVLGLTAADLGGRPGRAARQNVAVHPGGELRVLVLQGSTELHALHADGLPRVVVVLQEGTDTVGEEAPGAGRGIRLLALLLLRGGRHRGGGLHRGRATELGTELRELALHRRDGREDRRDVESRRHFVGLEREEEYQPYCHQFIQFYSQIEWSTEGTIQFRSKIEWAILDPHKTQIWHSIWE